MIVKEGELPVLIPPGVEERRINRYHRVLIGESGEILMPRKPTTTGMEYSCVDLGIDRAIRQIGHIHDSVAERTKRKRVELMELADFTQFRQQTAFLVSQGARINEKYTTIEWILR